MSEGKRTEEPVEESTSDEAVPPTEEAPQTDASAKQANGSDCVDTLAADTETKMGVDQEESPDTTPHSPVAPSTNSVVDGVEGQSLKELETGETRMSPEPETNGDAEDPAVYVGIPSWEGRTCKELTCLREDMFRARIGGVR